ncbi:condensation domain-containing protein, partial [Aquimarina algiphila]
MSNIISPLEIIHSAQSKGIKLFVDQGKLAVKKEKNVVLPSSLINLIKDHKSDLISFLETEIESSLGSNNLQIKRIKKSESYSVSDAQYRLWLVSQKEEGSIAYNISSVVNLDRTLDVTSFQEAVNAVIERHEILRTVFRIEETGEVRQYIKSSEEMGFSIDFKDCRGRDDANSYCQKYIETDKNKSFNLIDGPLFRASLLQLSNDRYIFYYNMHHIISDAWSKEVLSRDVMKYYEAYVTDSIPDISPLRIQYKDYAAWQLDELNSSSFQDHKNYWLSQFSTAPPVINLPTSKRRPKIKTYNGRELGIQLSSEITSKLRDFTLERGGTLSMGLLTVWKVLIYRYTGQTDITIGNPVAGRDHPDLEDQIGFYINVLPLRNKINPDHNFIQLFDQIKKNTLLAYKHQMYPFGKLLEDLSYIRDTSRSPLFDIDMDYHVTSKESLNPNSDEGVCDRGTSFAKFDIEFDPIESKDGVYIQIRFNTDVYDHGMIEKFILHYQSLLSCLL